MRPETPGAVPETKLDLSKTPEVNDVTFPVPDKEVKAPALAPYPGMGKEDLLRFSQSPFWVRLRLACLAAFWLGWLAILGAVIGLTIVAPRCTAPDDQDWWQTGTIYQIYVRSFYDSDGNGVGDIPGIEAKLDYIEKLNVDAIVLSSFYPSGIALGYDVTDHQAIDSEYGTMDDFTSLLEAAHDRDIKVLLDFIPNHTGDQHPWFIDSANDPDPGPDSKWNYYVWQNCAPTLPTNWVSLVGEPAWNDISNPSRPDQCYLRQFLKEQPDLNLRSTGVRQELEAILRFWLEAGVDGFRVNTPDFLFEDADLNNEPIIACDSAPSDYLCYDHIYTRSQPEVLDMVASWRDILDSYTSSTGQTRVLVTDARNTLNDSLTYYGRGGDTGAHLPLNYALKTLTNTCGGSCVHDLVDQWVYNMPVGATATWVTGSQDGTRLLSSLGPQYAGAVAIMTMTLPGVPFVYYGEEIGMVDGDANLPPIDPIGQIIPEWSRDPFRTPMQWSDATNAGFTNNSSPWLPANEDYPDKNVQVQEAAHDSILKLYRNLTQLRRDEGAFQHGSFHYALTDNNIFSFIREYEGDDSFITAINFGTDDVTVNLYESHYLLPKRADVYLVTAPNLDGVEVGEEANLEALTLPAAQGVVIGWPYTR